MADSALSFVDRPGQRLPLDPGCPRLKQDVAPAPRTDRSSSWAPAAAMPGKRNVKTVPFASDVTAMLPMCACAISRTMRRSRSRACRNHDRRHNDQEVRPSHPDHHPARRPAFRRSRGWRQRRRSSGALPRPASNTTRSLVPPVPVLPPSAASTRNRRSHRSCGTRHSTSSRSARGTASLADAVSVPSVASAGPRFRPSARIRRARRVNQRTRLTAKAASRLGSVVSLRVERRC